MIKTDPNYFEALIIWYFIDIPIILLPWLISKGLKNKMASNGLG